MRDKKNLVEMICDVVRDIIPDIEGRFGTLRGQASLYFFSKEIGKRFDKLLDDDDFDWTNRRFCFLVEDAFPEFVGCVFDNSLFLTPEEQLAVRDRLENLKEFLERNKEAKNE